MSRRERIGELTCLLLVTVLYYLVPGTAAHTEIRYVLPMHGLLFVFAGAGFELLRRLQGARGSLLRWIIKAFHESRDFLQYLACPACKARLLGRDSASRGRRDY